jgi:hypothetical protein
MKKIIFILSFFLMATVSAHSGSHLVGESIFDKFHKYEINNGDTHIGHFYLIRSRVSRKANEKLKVEHTVHLESDVVKKFSIKYNDKTSLISYKISTDTLNYYFNFYLEDTLLTGSNPGSMVIYDSADNSFTVANVTLDVIEPTAETTGHTHDN